ncbi:MAG: F0F1 ATP synthase subunit B [Acidimicrobiales bacterium]
MRIRVVLTGVLLSLVALFGWAGRAAAQEGEGGEEIEFADHEAEECFEVLEGGGKVDECQEAPSLILPATNEIVWGSISFAVLLVLLYKFAWPGIKQGMQSRTERIRADLEDAERAKDEARGVLTDYQRQLADARNEAGRIMEEARQAADAYRRDQQTRADAEIAEIKQRAAADAESAKAQALADLRSEVAQLALGAAETVVQRSLDRDTQLQLIDDYINQVGSRSN